MTARPHILHTLGDTLLYFRDNILMMGSLAERNLHNATQGLLHRDQELCNAAIVDDEEIDFLEKQMDFDGLEIIRRFHPVACDLRAVVASMRISANVERVADQATSIARRALKLNQQPRLEGAELLEPLIRKAVGLYKDSLRAFSDHDIELARSLKGRDKEIDEMNAAITGNYTELISRHLDEVHNYLAMIFISRHLERIGDHATNIGEDVVFAASAEDIRHGGNRG